MAREIRLQPGAKFAGVFTVCRVLGHGTMGSVYEVTDALGAKRALKTMKADLLTDPKFVQRFMQEAEVGARIKSPHVVQVAATGVDRATGLPWLAMEYLEGGTLDAWLETGPTRAGVALVLEQLFGAVAAAHAANIVHRDLKPENVLVTGPPEAPFVKVLDFGIAKVVRESTTLTGTTPGLGTPMWTAPEQTREGTRITPAADVWALGLITFRALSGKPFWRSANDAKSSAYDVAMELVKAPIPAASARAAEIGVAAALPPGFDAWFARAVVRDPAARFPTAAEARAGLAPLIAPLAAPPRARNRTVVILLAVALAAAAVAAWALFR